MYFIRRDLAANACSARSRTSNRESARSEIVNKVKVMFFFFFFFLCVSR